MHSRQFHALRGILYRRTGIFLPVSRAALVESRLVPRITELGLETFEQYLRFLSLASHQAEELQEVLERIDTVEPRFFRDPVQLEHFRTAILPAILDRCAPEKRIRIWCPGCGSGEDACTIALIVHDALGALRDAWNIQILGTDISPRSIERCALAEYAEPSVISVPPEIREAHFYRRGVLWVLDASIASTVTFALHNLTSALGARRLGTWDAIVCRTTLASFDPTTRAKIVGIFHDQLAPRGCLLVGPGDITREADDLLTRIDPPDLCIFTK